ncbi:probable leucine--tRNA ligase, mitochondrial isoform X2 [Venturia canescens]|nr:probable leucine--tRNA ligase, mitochondrial isoform X2 [Venturia canescens]
MGWDAFGLPAENAAMDRKIDPSEWTNKNIHNMREQLNRMSCLFDWDREVATCDPEYYRWTQELFLKLYERGLAYQKESFVNWDPVDCTVLADEQVDHENRSWRSGAKVEKKLLNQWFIKTTAFAESLLEGLGDPSLKEWRDIIKMQRHWIGECTGTSIEFELITEIPDTPKTLNLWTDKPESIEHAKFVAISKDNFLAKSQWEWTKHSPSRLIDAKVRNPFTGENLPIYLTNDVEFTRFRDNHLGIPGRCDTDRKFCDSLGILYEILEEFSDEEKMIKRLEIMGKARELNIGGFPVSLKLRDWLISRQRYWGTPIPIIHCETCGSCPVPRDQLPVVLPKISRDLDDRIKTLRDAASWLQTTCPKCNRPATREADTMDTFVDSSWYFMRYLDPKNRQEMFSKEKAFEYLPVDVYVGGKEHAVLHLYYARFVSHFLHSLGLVPTREPFKQLLVQGMVMGKTYKVKETGKFLPESEVEKIDEKYVEKQTGNEVVTYWDKMSKSKFNGVDPLEMFKEYGADTTRLIILADVAPTSNRHWSSDTFPGILKWQSRLWLTIRSFINMRTHISPEERSKKIETEKFIKDDDYMFDSRNYYIKGVTFNLVGSQQLSVAISKMQGLTNSIRKVSNECVTHSREYERALATQIIMLAPLAPQFASELWSGFCSAPYHLADDDTSIRRDLDVLNQKWPVVDMKYNLDLDVFVNEVEIFSLKVPRYSLDEMTMEEASRLVAQSPKFLSYVGDQPINNFKFHSEPGCDAKIKYRITRMPKNKKKKIAN